MNRLYGVLPASILFVCCVSAHAAGGLYGQVTSLTEPPAPVQLDGFGHGNFSGIALSSDGQTAVVAAATASVGGASGSGKVFIYQYATGKWSLSQEIDDPAPVANDEFGSAIAIAGNGTSLLVGSNVDSGKVYLYTLNNGAWNLGHEFDDPAGTAADSFGSTSLSLSADGATAVIGACGTNGSAGEAYIFHDVSGSWSLVKSIPDPDATSTDQFGNTVAISADGSSLIVGSNASINGRQFAGKAYLYTLNNGTWLQDSEIDDPAAAAGDFFGESSVAISADGQTVTIGAYGANGSLHGEGYIFSKASGTWTQVAAIADPDAGVQYKDAFGRNVAISGNGARVLIGSQAEVNGQYYAGKAYLYALDNGQWTQVQVFEEPTVIAGAGFGYTGVALSADGETAFISAGAAIVNNLTYAGEAYLYQSLDDISIALSPDPDAITAGQQTKLNVTVTNTDPVVTANNVTLTDTLPSGLSYVSSNAAGGDCSASGATVTCVLASLAPNDVWQPSISVTANAAGTLSDTATVASSEPDPNTANNTAIGSVTVAASSGNGGGSGSSGGSGGSGTSSGTPGKSGGGALGLMGLGLLTILAIGRRRRCLGSNAMSTNRH